jgi:hypothetical protein
MDALVTMVIFLLYTSLFLSIVEIESPTPIATDVVNEELNKNKPIQLTLKITEEEIKVEAGFGSMFSKAIPKIEIEVPVTERPGDVPDENTPMERKLDYDYNQLHETLVEVKNRWPYEKAIIMMPYDGVSYDSLVQIMDMSRYLFKTDPPRFKKVKDPETGEEMEVIDKELFPKIIYGNTMS